MRTNRLFRTYRSLKGDEGQVLALMAIAFVVVVSAAALSVDVGRAFYKYRELQNSTNAAALAGAEGLPSTTAASQAITYSSMSGDNNAQNDMPTVTMPAGYPKLLCLTTLTNQGILCPAPAGANAVQVQQQTIVPMFFARIFGKSSLTLTATATAAAQGAGNMPYNVAIILDTTLSQTSSDDNCGSGTTEMTCELNGVGILLKELDPCSGAHVTCTFTNGVAQDSVDRVALFTFPDVSAGTVGIDSNCTTPISPPDNWRRNGDYGYTNQSPYGWYTMLTATPIWSGVPTAGPYSFPTVGASSYSPGSNTPTYQVTPFLSDYKTSDTATSLNPSSTLTKAIGAVNGCGGMMPPNYDGNYGTYYAGVLYAAQSSLVSQQVANPGSQNVIIILSDGDATAQQSAMPSPATSNGTYPSWNNECAQAVTAAQYASSKGTIVYSVAYGSKSSGCNSDSSNITPCQTMTQMATNPQDFYSDYLQSGSNSTCVSTSNPNDTSIAKIFADIHNGWTRARLIPNGTS